MVCCGGRERVSRGEKPRYWGSSQSLRAWVGLHMKIVRETRRVSCEANRMMIEVSLPAQG